MEHIESCHEVPINTHTTYIVDIDGVLLFNNETVHAFNNETVKWFQQLVLTVGVNNVLILTARDALCREITLEQLRQNGFDHPHHLVFFTREKGTWIATFREHFRFQRIVMIDDQRYNLMDIKYHNPDVMCYHVNAQLINDHAVVYDLSQIKIDPNYMYLVDVDGFTFTEYQLFYNLYRFVIANIGFIRWFRDVSNKAKVLSYSSTGISTEMRFKINSTDKVVLITRDTRLYHNLRLEYPHLKVISLISSSD